MAKRGPEIVGERPIKFRPPQIPRLTRRMSILLGGFLLLFMLVLVPYFMFLEYVRPNEFGIKEIKVGLDRGIQKQVYGPGYVLVVPFMQMIHKLPQQVQVLELTSAEWSDTTAAQLSESVHHELKPAKIQTSDGFYVDVDVSILYRIIDPYKVITTLGPDRQFLYQGILPKAEPILKQGLGQLTTEEFYVSPMRAEKTQLAKEYLDAEMQKWGMQVDHVLVRYFKYTDAIQQNIEEKKLQDQLVFTNQSKGKAAAEELNLNHVMTEGKMQVEITHQEGEAYRVLKEAERDLYVRTKRAEADLLVQLAEAERTKLRNASMQESGSDRLVALRMAEVLQGLQMIVLPAGGENALNPLDLNAMLATFSGTQSVSSAANEPVPAAAPSEPAAPPPPAPGPSETPAPSTPAVPEAASQAAATSEVQ